MEMIKVQGKQYDPSRQYALNYLYEVGKIVHGESPFINGCEPEEHTGLILFDTPTIGYMLSRDGLVNININTPRLAITRPAPNKVSLLAMSNGFSTAEQIAGIKVLFNDYGFIYPICELAHEGRKHYVTFSLEGGFCVWEQDSLEASLSSRKKDWRENPTRSFEEVEEEMVQTLKSRATTTAKKRDLGLIISEHCKRHTTLDLGVKDAQKVFYVPSVDLPGETPSDTLSYIFQFINIGGI